MTDPDITPAQSLIASARQALSQGDRRAARHYAEQAAALDPTNEQPWLVLAFLASPRAARYYVERAAQANPSSPQMLAAREWLEKQATLLEEDPKGLALRAPEGESLGPLGSDLPAPSEQPASLPEEDPKGLGKPLGSDLPAPAEAPRRAKRLSPWLVASLVVLALLAGLAFLTYQAPPADNKDATLVSVVQTVIKAGATKEPTPTPTASRTPLPSATPTQADTATPSPTWTASPSATFTASPAPSATPTVPPTAPPTAVPPTATQPPKPTAAPSTYTVRSGDTLNLIAQRMNVSLQSLIAANKLANPSLIKAGQVLTIPAGGSQPAAAQPTAAANPVAASGNGKEILIDISEQHMYAYENGNLVFSYVVSTGIGNSTRIGKFKVLDKIPNAYSNAFNIWMPYWMGIYYSGTLENGIHGLPLLWNGVELWRSLLGKPATYGCIEATTPEIKALYNWAEIGTPVIIRP